RASRLLPSFPTRRSSDLIEAVLAVAADAGRYRASLARSSPLMTAMGRPNREQVVSVRSSIATTLEALELTNGAVLAGLLERGARSEEHTSELPSLTHLRC